MDLKEEVAQLRQTGMEKAAVIWEMLEALPTPIAPTNIYKAACSVKAAEFLARTRTSPIFHSIMNIIALFMDETIGIAGESTAETDRIEGFQAIELFEREMPLSAEIFDDAAAYATRQHVYDGIIILAAAKLGKEEETKASLERMQQGVARAMITAVFQAALLQAADENPDDNE
jgi:hypothetical protein